MAQKAYSIAVTVSGTSTTMWTSGVVADSRPAAIYAGAPLQDFTTYLWSLTLEMQLV